MRSKSGKQKERNWAELLCFGCICLQLWPKIVLRKWLNISSKDSEFSADEGETTESEFEYEEMCHWERQLRDEERKLGRLSAESDGRHMDGIAYRKQRRKSETLRAEYINAKELRICAGTWNVGGRLPSDCLEIEDWLGMEDPADIYVIGLQEIVPLNAGNIFGAEDNRPVPKWEHIIRRTLNKIQPAKKKYKSYSDPPSPSRFQLTDDNIAFDEALMQVNDSDTDDEIHPLEENSLDFETSSYSCSTGDHKLSGNIFKNADFFARQPLFSQKVMKNSYRSSFKSLPVASEESVAIEKNLTKMLSSSERMGLAWPEQPLDFFAQLSLDSSNALNSYKSFKTPNYSRLASQDYRVEDIAKKKRRSSFVRIISKQMVGIYLSIWVRRSLRKHIQNLKVSSVGVGVMGYIGNKGSISVSMSIYQTLFCFVCCHLTSGEKEGEKLRRNADVQEIHRRTLFRPSSCVGLPKIISDHERIFWLGDLNYRLDLPYEMTHELITRKKWSQLAEGDQLKKELKKGRLFDGWSEGVIYFPPTYKYERNSEKYIGEDPKLGRRTPAWCDRILSFGKGIRLLDYKRTELKLSDHRPVNAIFAVDIEMICCRKLQRVLAFVDGEIEEGDHLSDEDVDDEMNHYRPEEEPTLRLNWQR